MTQQEKFSNPNYERRRDYVEQMGFQVGDVIEYNLGWVSWKKGRIERITNLYWIVIKRDSGGRTKAVPWNVRHYV